MQPSQTPPDPQYYTHSFTTDVYRSSPCALESTYDVTSDSWGGQFIIFGGGEDGWTEIPHDFSDYNYVIVCIKAKSAAENPRMLKVEMVDRTSPPYPDLHLTITTGWYRYAIPLSAFSGLNKKNLRKMTFVYERDGKAGIDAAGGSRTGVLYIDDIQFEK